MQTKEKEENREEEEVSLKMKENTKPPLQESPASPMFVAGVVTFYFIISMSVVFLNKHILVSDSVKFPFALTSTWIQLVVALGCLILLGEFNRGGRLPFPLPPFALSMDIAKKILPLTVVYVGMLAFNNLCLYYVQVSMYNVARSQSLTFNIIMTYYFLNKKTSFRALIACGFIVVGYLMGVRGTIEVTIWGIVFGLFSSFFVSFYGIMVEKILPIVNRNHWILLQYNTALAIIILLPLCAIFEFQGVLSTENLITTEFIAVMFITSIAGFLINIAMFLQIKYTSALTGIVSGTAKASVQTVIGLFLFSETLGTLESLSVVLIIIASSYYSYVRYQEAEERKRTGTA